MAPRSTEIFGVIRLYMMRPDRFSGFHNRGRFLRLGAASQRDNENKVPVLISITG